MGRDRVNDIIVGPETSTAPTPATPSADEDTITKGYADDTYAMRSDGLAADVANTAALKAIPASGDNAYADNQIRFKEDTRDFWQYDSTSTSTEDGSTVIEPDSGTGRWHLAGGSTAAASNANNLELLKLAADSEYSGVITPIDNAARVSGAFDPPQKQWYANLMQDHTSSATIYLAWNARFINDSDKDTDSATGWTVQDAGTGLSASAGSNKIGANKLDFDKDNSAVDASIIYDRGSADFLVGENYRLWFWIYLPSTTDLDEVWVEISDGTNSRRWPITTDYAGNSFSAAAWNLILVDLSDETGTSTGGSGLSYTDNARYFEIGVNTGSATQTYSNILIDAIHFSYGNQAEVGMIGQEITVYDNSNVDDVVIDNANTINDGAITLTATLATSYSGGTDASDASTLKRSVPVVQSGAITFDSDLSSGDVVDEQTFRISRMLRASVSLNLDGFVELWNAQIYKVTDVPSGTTIEVEDPGDTSADLLDTETIEVFETLKLAGETFFEFTESRAMTANSSHSSGTTTLTVADSSNVSIGDYIAKRNVTAQYSAVTKTADESFSSFSLKSAPDGVRLLAEGIPYPNPSEVYGHWWLGGVSEEEATRNRFGPGPDLTVTGSVTFTQEFYRGRSAFLGDLASTDNVSVGQNDGTAGANSLFNISDGDVMASFWYYHKTVGGNDTIIMGNISKDGSSQKDGWGFMMDTDDTIELKAFTNNVQDWTIAPAEVFVEDTWYHIAGFATESGTCELWINGVSAGTTTGSGTDDQSRWTIGGQYNAAGTSYADRLDDNQRLADLIVWLNATKLSDEQVAAIYNAGLFRPVGVGGHALQYNYGVTGQTGQKISMKATLTRDTTGVQPSIGKMGILKV